MGLWQTTVWVASALPVTLTMLSLVRSARWWIRLWDYPRLQIAFALGIVAVLQILWLPRGVAAAGLHATTLGCLAWQLSQIWRYTVLAPVQVRSASKPDPASTIAVMVANVLQQNRRADAFLARVAEADPDLLLVVETDDWWDARIMTLRERYPHVVRHPLPNTYGMHLFSRLPLLDARLQDRVSPGIPSVFTRVRLRSGQEVDVHCVHPEPPQIGNDVHERDAELLLVAREVARDARPTIVCGDLNDVAWSFTTRLFQRISGLLDPRVGRGLYPTFHAEHWFARWPLDHVFHDASFRVVRLRRLAYFGSDHFPVLVCLAHEPTAVLEQAAPAADGDDREEAAEKIADVCGPRES